MDMHSLVVRKTQFLFHFFDSSCCIDVFYGLHDHVHGRNLRAVIWNRREYPGSTKYTDSEADDLTNGRKIFLDQTAALIADFLVQFIEKEGIPEISPDHKRGGVAILGWSLGTPTALSLFSNPSAFPSEEYALLRRYVKNLVIYGNFD